MCLNTTVRRLKINAFSPSYETLGAVLSVTSGDFSDYIPMSKTQWVLPVVVGGTYRIKPSSASSLQSFTVYFARQNLLAAALAGEEEANGQSTVESVIVQYSLLHGEYDPYNFVATFNGTSEWGSLLHPLDPETCTIGESAFNDTTKILSIPLSSRGLEENLDGSSSSGYSDISVSVQGQLCPWWGCHVQVIIII